jgi:hypothetical protein
MHRFRPTNIASLLGALLLSSFAFAANAAPVPYVNTGTENTIEYTFTATTTGDIVAYFAGKGGAFYSNNLTMSVNGVPTGITGLNNQSSAYGQALNLGFANAGDTIVFYLQVADTGKTWSSIKGQNVDGLNHVYSSAFGGDESLSAGLYVGFEDLAIYDTPDFNYTDEQFIVTNVTAPSVPVPAAAWLFGSGLLGMAGIARRRSKIA